jgi:predicted site-specific integrase-resolvase
MTGFENPDPLLTPGEVAEQFLVHAKTVTRWAAAGRFEEGETLKTPGGHLRVRTSAVRRLLGLVDPAEKEGSGMLTESEREYLG